MNAAKLISLVTGNPVIVLNDADAAALAEMRGEAGKGRNGGLLPITIGTEPGSDFWVMVTLL